MLEKIVNLFKDWGGVGALAVSIFTWVATRAQSKAALENNFIAATAPWASLLIDQIARELELAQQDRAMVQRMYVAGFESLAAKQRARGLIIEGREKSAAVLSLLMSLTPEAKTLDEKRKRLDKVEDTFLWSEDIAVPKNCNVVERYAEAYELYMSEIVSFAMSVNLRRALAKSKPRTLLNWLAVK